jgi:hypothetical protein
MAKDSGGALRQHYKLATGASLQGSAPGPTPGFAKGGRVMKAAVPSKMGNTVKGFTNGIPTSGAKNIGTVKTTTNAKGRDPRGFDLHGPGGKKRNV